MTPQIETAMRKLDGLRVQSSALAAMTTDPTDPRWDALDLEIEQTQASIRRMERIEAAGQAQRTAAQAAARAAASKAAYDEAVKLAKGRIALATKIDAAIDALKPLLEQWDDVGKRCRFNAASVHRTDNRPDWSEVLIRLAQGDSNAFSAALETGLFNAGVGRIGIIADTGRIPFHRPPSLRAVAENASEKLAFLLRESLENSGEE